ncbi:hypothetical protein PMIT1313_01851 [Prochlorococcus marinus str. MIT 1313]|uniref:DUF3386 domain-containing protein n=1 Tax=Prochlorococcus TaxID=1218 RepID=UPI0007B3576F|nr:DUF3386 domain-containing protein [Prochlorococcus marinus]KZR69388.1 hypothetical protein PMIT1313_01851 [Prochlorococcus marinus str. MIT 1313]KZR71592.1 hypothetical protein PMIT1318_01397 [Prochlorococcus marinus str. MIT 1318]
MIANASPIVLAPGSDCRELFQAAYENRYTWDPVFSGYRGRCLWVKDDLVVEGKFELGADLKAHIDGIEDELIAKAVSSQLWEVAIHRVRRSFEKTHGENTFTAGDNDEVGLEVIVGGKNLGDRYRIKNDVVTMVHRHIHGTVVTIFTKSTTDTGCGYLSHTYSSQYHDPKTNEPTSGVSQFTDTFVPLADDGLWVLSERLVEKDAFAGMAAERQLFKFVELEQL